MITTQKSAANVDQSEVIKGSFVVSYLNEEGEMCSREEVSTEVNPGMACQNATEILRGGIAFTDESEEWESSHYIREKHIPPHRILSVTVTVWLRDSPSQPEAQDCTDPYPDTSLDKESPLSGSS